MRQGSPGAKSYYRQGMLPGTGIASTPAPDLHALGLQVTGASNGTLASQPVTAYVYSDDRGTRQIYVFLSVTVFQAVTPHGGAPPKPEPFRGTPSSQPPDTPCSSSDTTTPSSRKSAST